MMREDMLKDEHTEWAALYSLGALAPEEKVYFEKHLASGCTACAAEMEKFDGLVSRLARASECPPPLRLRERLLAAVKQAGAPSADGAGREADEAKSRVDTGKPAGILFQHAGLLISRSNDMSWQPAGIAGISSKTLFVDSQRQYATTLVSMEPGTAYPSHRHNDIEEVYLLEGDLLVEGVSMGPGDYCRSEPGSIHGAAKTNSGVLLLVFSSQRDELLT